jgi:hypothetical protein
VASGDRDKHFARAAWYKCGLMLQVVREFRVGRPQVFAGLMLLAFLAQCLWTAKARKISELEYQYMLSGLSSSSDAPVTTGSPFTSLMAAVPLKVTAWVRKLVPTSALSGALAVPRPWLLRLPFVIFGVWLGAALWWVARRLFDDEGGYVALGLYCTSPAIIKISGNIGPEIILAWSSLGLIYTAIGVAHTLYAPPRKWVPRIVILGLSIGFALATAWWSITLVLLAFAYMIYLAPGCRKKAMVVLLSASAVGCLVVLVIIWLTGSTGMGVKELFAHKPTLDALRNLAFAISAESDGYVLVFLLRCLHVRPAPGYSHVGRNFGAEFCVYICWRCSGRPSGDRGATHSNADFGRMFSGQDRSNGYGAGTLGTKLNVTSVDRGLS